MRVGLESEDHQINHQHMDSFHFSLKKYIKISEL